MRRLVVVLGLILMATGAMADETFTISGEECSPQNFRWNGERSYVAEETIDGGSLRSLKASVKNAPMSVTGGSTSGYSIEVCKAAQRAEDLSEIRVFFDGNELRSTGPDNHRWTVKYHIRVPRNADLDLEAHNGPLSLRDVDGTIVVRSQNGPLSLRNVSGNVDATAQNGPISLRGGAGTVNLKASNGPLSIQLDGSSWQGGSLDASTRNGPLSVKIPNGYASGVMVESRGRGPVSCKAEGCERFRTRIDVDGRWDDEPRRIELGSGPATVRLSTVNGPVTIKDK